MKVQFPSTKAGGEIIGTNGVKNIVVEDRVESRNGIKVHHFWVGEAESESDCAIWVKYQDTQKGAVIFLSLYAEEYSYSGERSYRKEWGIGIAESEKLAKDYAIEHGITKMVLPELQKPKVVVAKPIPENGGEKDGSI
jgi:hypothetical protein